VKPDLQMVPEDQPRPEAPPSFTRAYEENFSRIYNYIHYRVGEAATADDLTSITFHKGLDHFASFDPDQASFTTWLLNIARNTVNDHQRKIKRRHRLLQRWWHPRTVSKMDPERIMIVDEERDSLMAAIAALSAEERDIIGLKFAASETNRAIAALVGQSESNIGVLVHRAMKKLRAALEETS